MEYHHRQVDRRFTICCAPIADTLAGDHRHLLEGFRYVHAARKVVGVGTRVWILLMLGSDDSDPLFLQAKEAQASVREPFLGKSRYRNRGLGLLLGARALAEFGDDPGRYADAKARKNYFGMSPITKASRTKRVVLTRFARNRHLGDALLLHGFAALNSSPGARAFYDRQRGRGATDYQARRTLANQLAGILHGCLRTTPSTTNTTPGTRNKTNSARQLDRLRQWDV